MKVMVTGGAGFIGSAVCRQAVRIGWSVLNFDALTYAASLSSLDEIASAQDYVFVQGDVRDHRAVADALDAFRPDAVVHLAAETHVDRSITNSAAFVETNVVGTHTMLEAVRAYWESLRDDEKQGRFRFVHVSTDEVFGSVEEGDFFRETSRYDPRSPYSASKAASDHLVRAWGHTYGLPVIISNCSNNYGPYQFPEKFIPLMIVSALRGLPLRIYGDGCNVRDWLYVEDHVAALLLLLEKGEPGETYMIGGRSQLRNIDVAHAVISSVARFSAEAAASEISYVPDRPGHDRRYAIDCSKIERELGWRPQMSFSAGLDRTVQWYAEHLEWWGPILEEKYGGERLGLGGL